MIREEIGKGLDSRIINKEEECDNCRYVKEQVTELESQVILLKKENKSLKQAANEMEEESQRIMRELENAQARSEALV